MKKVLFVAGGGTLGTYTKDELLRLGHSVDIICLEDYVSENEKLKYYKANADYTFLESFLKDKYYDAVVNFIHYTDVSEYKKVHMLISSKTDHMVFLSSYRVYADLQHPVTETAPQLYDVTEDEEFLAYEDYAVPKSKCEHFIKEESGTSNWTIVRPVISFSKRRFDIATVTGRDVIDKTARNEEILLPQNVKNLTAGLDWAGNTGKLIAHLLFKENAFGESFTVSTAQNLTWGEIADIYTELIGAKFKWVSTEEYLDNNLWFKENPWCLKYDRFFDRKIDNTKIFNVTNLKKEDFTSVRDGIKIEIGNLKGDV